MTLLNQSDNQLFPSLPEIKFQMLDVIGGTFTTGTLDKDQAEFWEDKAEKDLTNSIEEYVMSEDKDKYIELNKIPERHQNIRSTEVFEYGGIPEFYLPDRTTDLNNISEFYGPILEIGKVIYIVDADSEEKLGSFKIKREMIDSSVDSSKGIKYHFKKPIFGSETNRCEYVSESFEIEEKFDISKFAIKTVMWNECEIITSILYNYEPKGWWPENEKSLEPTLDIG